MTSNNTWYLYLHVRVVTIDDAIWWWNKSLILKRDFGILVIMNYSLPSWIEKYFRNEYSWVFILDWWTIRDLLANENVYLKIWIFHLDFFFFLNFLAGSVELENVWDECFMMKSIVDWNILIIDMIVLMIGWIFKSYSLCQLICKKFFYIKLYNIKKDISVSFYYFLFYNIFNVE